MLLLSEQKDYERLYDAASTSLSLLDPTGPAKQRIVIARAMAARAAAARALGRNEEAIDMYEQAIALYEAEDPELLRGSEQADAFGDLAALLSDLGREREALALNARMLGAHAKRAKRAVRRKFGPKRTKSD
jgi:tetratricopeptide (TPR) repeat protein